MADTSEPVFIRHETGIKTDTCLLLLMVALLTLFFNSDKSLTKVLVIGLIVFITYLVIQVLQISEEKEIKLEVSGEKPHPMDAYLP